MKKNYTLLALLLPFFFHYSFPVAMADGVIEKKYNISSYSSKILISPQGKYLVIPFNTDWVNFVKKYADL